MKNNSLGYLTTTATGSFVGLKTHKDGNDVLHTRLVDFKLGEKEPSRVQDNLLPNGTSFLFELDDNDKDCKYQSDPLMMSGQVPLKLNYNEWIDLTATFIGNTKKKLTLKNPLDRVQIASAQFFRNSDTFSRLNASSSIQFVSCGSMLTHPKVYKCNKRIVGYYTSWIREHKFTFEQGKHLTHVIYSFFPMDSDFRVKDNLTDEANERLKSLLDVARLLPHLKVMFARGGWENSQYFSPMISNVTGRKVFIDSVLDIMHRWDFDGVDIDYEHPGTYTFCLSLSLYLSIHFSNFKKVTGGAVNGTVEDKENYVLMMKELREALNAEAKKRNKDSYLLTFASAAGKWSLDVGYDLPSLLKYADWVNVMTYDYFGAWQSKWGVYTGPVAPLHFGGPQNYSQQLTVEWSIKYHLCRINDPSKVVVGVPFYGRYWNNVGLKMMPNDDLWRIAKPTRNRKWAEGGDLSYREINNELLKNVSFKFRFHKKALSPYLWSEKLKILISYENEDNTSQTSLRPESQFGRHHDLVGGSGFGDE